MNFLSAGTKKSGRCGEVAVSVSSTVSLLLIGQRREVLSVVLRLEKVKLGVDIALP